MTTEELLKYDKEHLWHPYTSMINSLPVFPVKRCEGVYIELDSGEKLIDGMSSWWCAVHGYNNSRLNAAATKQLESMSHVMFGGLTHAPAVELAKKLVDMTPEGLDRVFYCDSGSVSVEIAIKMALQYQFAASRPNKNKIITIRSGYHGDTWHAMSVCDPVTGMHSLYSDRLPCQLFIDTLPTAFYDEWNNDIMTSTRKIITSHCNEIAAFILEPIVQGAGGMRFYHPKYLQEVSKLCRENNIVLIADEVATGFGRSGKMFACEWADITPDIMCLGKALTGGYISFAAVMATAEIAETISSKEPYVFMHGPTFMGNPLACAIALESLNILTEKDTLARIKEIEGILKRELVEASTLDTVAEVRVLGAIGVIEMKSNVDMAAIQKMFIEEGVWIRPFGRLIYIMPQYIITDDQLILLCQAMKKVVNQL